MVAKSTLKHVLATNQQDVEHYQVIQRQLPDEGFGRRIFVGVRRAGKSFMLYQKMQQRLHDHHGWDTMLYLNFEDDRLSGFTLDDFDLILECHAEMYDARPMLFLDEIQVIEGWEKYARRLADAKYDVWLTGSNAQMLSSEMMSALGGRYLITEVYPYDFTEFLHALHYEVDDNSLFATEHRARLVRKWEEYLSWGGLPESVGLNVKRDYLSSTYQKIYLGDIASRNKIANQIVLRMMLKKIAENVGRPISYNRLTHVLSSVGGKVTMPTVSRYIDHAEAAWLLLRLRNINASFSDKEANCKYYFIDNGVLNLFLVQGESALLENVVALSLFRRYGHDPENERVFFYHDRIEVDFYVPEDQLAVQVAYSLTKSEDTYQREVDALKRLPRVLPCKRRLILTYDEWNNIEDEHGIIEVIPTWNWLLDIKTKE